MTTDPTPSTVKALFALSCNTCAVPHCEERLADPRWPEVKADIAHIHGARPGSARYDPAMTDDERRAQENLVLVCPNHHRLIDRLEPDEHPPDLLRRWKDNHESRCAGTWATDDDLGRYSAMLLRALTALRPDALAPRPTMVPRLVIERGTGDSIEAVNVGDADATRIAVEPIDEPSRDAFVVAQIPPERLSPGGRWRCGLYAATMGNVGPHVLRVTWYDDAGRQYQGEFPL